MVFAENAPEHLKNALGSVGLTQAEFNAQLTVPSGMSGSFNQDNIAFLSSIKSLRKGIRQSLTIRVYLTPKLFIERKIHFDLIPEYAETITDDQYKADHQSELDQARQNWIQWKKELNRKQGGATGGP